MATLRLFAQAREVAGTSSDTVDGATVDAVIAKRKVQRALHLGRVSDLAGKRAVKRYRHAGAEQLLHPVFHFKLRGFADLDQAQHGGVG